MSDGVFAITKGVFGSLSLIGYQSRKLKTSDLGLIMGAKKPIFGRPIPIVLN